MLLFAGIIGITGGWGAPAGATTALEDLADRRAEKIVLPGDPTTDLYDPETGLSVEREAECDPGMLHGLCKSGRELRARWYNGTVGLWIRWRGLPAYSEKAKLRTRDDLVADVFGMMPIQGRQQWALGFGVVAELRPGLGLHITLEGKEAPVFRWPMESGSVAAVAPDLLLFRVGEEGMLRSVDLTTGVIIQEVWMPESSLGLMRSGEPLPLMGIGSRGRPIFHHMKTKFLAPDGGLDSEDIESPEAGYELDIRERALRAQSDAGGEIP